MKNIYPRIYTSFMGIKQVCWNEKDYKQAMKCDLIGVCFYIVGLLAMLVWFFIETLK